MEWQSPSPRVRELIRTGAQLALSPPVEWKGALDEAVLAAAPVLASDPDLAAAASRSNSANLLHWAAANVRDPGAPVAANVGAEPLAIARDIVRRGLDERALDAYRVGQTVALRFWIQIAFSLTDDPAELRELLDITTASISTFVDATLAALEQQIRSERHDLTRGAHADRLAAVTLLLDGAPIPPDRAEERLGYRLDRRHIAAIAWSDGAPGGDARVLDRVSEALGRASGARPLSILASGATRWVWVPADDLDLAPVRAAVEGHPDVRVALGPAADGADGFRRSHLDALTTQRMLARLRSTEQVAQFSEVELVALITSDPEAAGRFVRRTLGGLAAADAELRRTVAMYIREQYNASRTAERLYTHRNTVLRRISRAQELLPAPLEESGAHVAVALEVLYWGAGGVT
ncbi:PucR family transcriptional regulator [Tsukamurella sp. 8F]|uniref:PucR family transcriptional regulator n=1 Tax=unclassified Tsukamurella TaxID=2633480 RepID=UPI0023B95A4E|nr:MULTISPECIES: PucR family transcriptional regulator [unclassified Tsukamurella]MDF0530106.1 PucR family transcriptional regulator [Tsukamurella sp. 8J]MDF0586424.1 PucR family transcriptional regulator [Tsukamurella sp. 8F]